MQHVPDGNHGGDQVDETDGIVLADWERNIGPSSARGFYYESLDFEVDNPRNISGLKKKRFRNQVKAMTTEVCLSIWLQFCFGDCLCVIYSFF